MTPENSAATATTNSGEAVEVRPSRQRTGSRSPAADSTLVEEPPRAPTDEEPAHDDGANGSNGTNRANGTNADRPLFDPIDDRLLEHFYRPEAARRPPAAKARPTHYKICCISLYTEDIERLEAMVAELKRRGHTKANKSQLIRAALDQVDLDRVPRGY